MIKSLEFVKEADTPFDMVAGPVSKKNKDGKIEKHLLLRLVYNEDNFNIDDFFDEFCDKFMVEMKVFRGKVKKGKASC
jgi:hypothetical protein